MKSCKFVENAILGMVGEKNWEVNRIIVAPYSVCLGLGAFWYLAVFIG